MEGELFVSPVYTWIVLFVAEYTVVQWKLKVNFYFTWIWLDGDTDNFSICHYVWSDETQRQVLNASKHILCEEYVEC